MKTKNILYLLLLYTIVTFPTYAFFQEEDLVRLKNIQLVSPSKAILLFEDESKEEVKIVPPLISHEVRRIDYKTKSGINISFNVMGENESIPKTLINEFTTKGNKKLKDRIELLFLEDGNIAGLTLTYGKEKFTFGDKEVHKGEYLVVEAEGGLSANNGSITLTSSPSVFARVLDKVVYSNKDEVVLADDNWNGTPINSRYSTATRSFNRRMKNKTAVDTNSASDWYITVTRGASWGLKNNELEYKKE